MNIIIYLTTSDNGQIHVYKIHYVLSTIIHVLYKYAVCIHRPPGASVFFLRQSLIERSNISPCSFSKDNVLHVKMTAPPHADLLLSPASTASVTAIFVNREADFGLF